MKNIGFIYSSDQRFEELIKANELSADKEYLIRVHTCIHNVNTIMPFVNKILSYLPHSKIIGSSTSGVIFEGQILTNRCMVSITEFRNAEVKTFMADLSGENSSDISGEVLADYAVTQLSANGQTFMLAFFGRPYMKIEDFVKNMNKITPQIHILGGIANTPEISFFNMKKQNSFVFNEHGASMHSVAFAAVSNNSMSVYSDIIYVTEPVGKEHTITDADEMIIRTVDGENAVEWYQNLLGINFSELRTDECMAMTSVFPIVKADCGSIPWAISYSPQSEEMEIFPDEPEPVMYVPNEVKTGEQIRISYSSVQKTIDVCAAVCENLCEHPSEVLFGYSCVSRQNMFSNCAKWELLPFEKTNLCGALVAGEIGNIENANRYCNYSFAIASLSESNSRIKLDIDALENHSDALVNSQKAIIDYLVRNANSEQNELTSLQQNEIKNGLFIDDDTGLGNVTKMLYDRSLNKFDKICMITIRNESLLKAFLSESKFLIYFNRYHKSIMNYIGDQRYRCYIYKKTALVITAAPEIPDDEFIAKITELQSVVADFKFSVYLPVSEFALVMHEEDMIKKAELTLVRMRNKKCCFLTYTAELGLEQFNAQKMKMIAILNEAISNDRVIPFFQGIRDNRRNHIRMYESLMRIEDSAGNVYTPYQFMNIAKEYGYYADISYIMINKVMEIFRNRNDMVTINMNVSDVYNYKIVHSVLEFLKTAPHPENFVFELTETEEVTDYQVIFEFVEQVHEAGGRIAIDDFGSGFSNIVNVFKIKSDYIKIDGEIIKNIERDIYALEFLEMISQWAEKHSKEVIAEFVENSRIQNIIEHNNIRFSQGYLYSKPSRIFTS